jgi:endonuclease/exonuclease/phosphatase family metal-dependent hydrolase
VPQPPNTWQSAHFGNRERDLSVISWNVFHGRDAPPDRSLFTTRSRLLRVSEDNGDHIQVNRSLRREYASLLRSASWHVCLLQEFPPRWRHAVASACSARIELVRTSRNLGGPLRGLAAGWNPDLLGANEGGSNAIMFRAPWTAVSSRSLVLNPFPGRGLAERRTMGFVQLARGQAQVCVANLHASAGDERAAEREILAAAGRALDWARGLPLVFGGDFNVRPGRSDLFLRLERELGLARPTGPEAIDHILVRGLAFSSGPVAWPAADRELEVIHGDAIRKLRLSDHAPVEAIVALPERKMQ